METKREFKVITNLCNENSFGVWNTDLDVILEVNIGFNDDGYGYFEFFDIASGGDKWYAEGSLILEGNKLIDYDGIFELPLFIIDNLIEMGIDCNDI
jgi:hypothetical protein